jgi:hypothetical protein
MGPFNKQGAPSLLRMSPVNHTLTHTYKHRQGCDCKMAYGSWPTSRSGALPYNKITSGKTRR